MERYIKVSRKELNNYDVQDAQLSKKPKVNNIFA